MFTPSNTLQKYMNAQPRDMFAVVGALMGYINADPAFKSNDFDQAIQYALEHGVSAQELFAEFNGDIDFEEDSSKWNEEYYSYARVYLQDNFCKKRIAHVKAVARKLYPVVTPEKPATPTRTTMKPAVQKTSQSRDTDSSIKKAKSQQSPAGKKASMPTVTKVVIAVVVIVLLALVIGLIVLKR